MSETILSEQTCKLLLIAKGIERLRKDIGYVVCRNLKENNEKVCKYFERAFVRWVFNAIRKGNDPFSKVIGHEDFVCKEDIDYFTEREGPSYGEKFATMNWSWLSDRFKDIHSFNEYPSVSFKFRKEGDRMTFLCEWLRKKAEYSMSCKQYYHSRSIYIGKEDPNVYLMILLARYEACGTINNHSSVPPEVIKFSGAKTELFGSPLNTVTEQYCSPFPDIEWMFGSMGSFFTFKFSSGIYFANPPFDEELMRRLSLRLIEVLSTNMSITVVVVIPAWDVQSQYEFHGKIYTYKEYDALKILEGSKFLRSKEQLNYQNHKFLDYYQNEYRALANCHLIVLSNTLCKITAYDISNYWKNRIT